MAAKLVLAGASLTASAFSGEGRRLPRRGWKMVMLAAVVRD